MTAAPRLGSYSEKAPSSYVLPDEGTYVIKLDDFGEAKPSNWIDKETGEYPLRIELKFKIVKDLEGDEEFANVGVSYWCGLDLNPNDRGSIWHVLLHLDPSVEPEPGMEIEDYRGKVCKGFIEHSKPKPNKEGVMTTFANLTKTMPIKKNKPAAKPTNALLADDDE